METIIDPIDKGKIKLELLKDKFVRTTNNGNKEIYIITHHDSPNTMLELGRLREITFRKAGGGTGKSADIDDYDTADITTVVQEIINRGGWSSGNDMGFLILNDGSGNGVSHLWRAYDGDSATAALLTIVYVGSSPSASQSPSSSQSPSPSLSPSVSPSSTPSPSPSQSDPFFGLRIAKEGKNVFTDQEPFDLKFSSDYGTLKYFSKQNTIAQLDASDDEIATTATINHNLGYYPFVEVFVRVYIGAPAGNYEYCPFAGAGAAVLYSATYKITTSDIVLYGGIDGVSASVWNFDFLVFIYKNNLNL